MPSKAAKKGEEKSVDLLSFFSEEKLEERGKVRAETSGNLSELELAVVSFLKSKGGKATKSELYQWAKKRGVAPAALYATITKMLQSGTIRRSFDESAQEIAFALA